MKNTVEERIVTRAVTIIISTMAGVVAPHTTTCFDAAAQRLYGVPLSSSSSYKHSAMTHPAKDSQIASNTSGGIGGNISRILLGRIEIVAE